MSQLSFLSIPFAKKKLRCEKFLNEMKEVVPWDKLCGLISPFYEIQTKVGRDKLPLLLMLKIHCLQQWYALSDPAMEEAIYDRNSFQRFLSVDLLSDRVPDETSILNFRHLLEAHDLAKAIFSSITDHLEEKQLLMKSGTSVDATLIAAPSSTKNKDKKRDPEMSSTKKNDQWYFGMKAHIGVDTTSGLVHSVEGSTAKTHDSQYTDALLHGKEKALFGDKAYGSKERKRSARQSGLYYGILDKGTRQHPLSASQKKRNKQLSSVRAKVEHPFQIIKCQWGYRKVRYRGIEKNLDQLRILFGLANLFKVRKQLLAMC